jgi:hypothetical protein
MKLELNLAIAPRLRERFALGWAVPATVAGLAGLAFLSISTLRQIREYRDVHRSIANHEVQEKRLRDEESALRKGLEQSQSKEVLRNAQYVNALIEGKQVSVTDLAAQILKLMPGQVRLTSLALIPQGGDLAVRLGIIGKSEEEVETFLGRLEDSPYFKDGAIINQGFEESGNEAGLVNIAWTARYMPSGH